MVRLRSPAPNKIYGGIPERPKGADCKSVVTDFAGPNPASPTRKERRVLAARLSFMVGEAGNGKRALRASCAAYRSRKANLEELSLRGIMRYAEL